MADEEYVFIAERKAGEKTEYTSRAFENYNEYCKEVERLKSEGQKILFERAVDKRILNRVLVIVSFFRDGRLDLKSLESLIGHEEDKLRLRR